MYYFILALVEIGIFLSDNWKDLTIGVLASGVGYILGKRVGVRFAVNYIMKVIGLNKKTEERLMLEWLIDLEKARGNVWSAEPSNFKLNIIGRSSRLRWVITSRVPPAGLFIRRMVTRKLILRRRKSMSKWIKPDKLTIILGVLITAANEYFGWTLDTANVGAFFFMLFTFFKQQEIVKIVRYAHGLPVAFKINSTKLVFTVLGVLIVALDQVKGMGLGLPEIITIAGFVSGYNIKEGNEDVKKAEQEGQLNEEFISTSEFEG